MAFSYFISQNDGVSKLEIRGEASIENADEIKKQIDEFLKIDVNLEISISKLTAADLTLFQILLSAKKTAGRENIHLKFNKNINSNIETFLEYSGLRDLIF